jgi:IclR family transcriptional regulator, pca regulon regulatory protein
LTDAQRTSGATGTRARTKAGADGAGQRLPIASLVKSLRVLEELAAAGRSSSVAELIARTGLERTTVQRVLRTLHAEGYVERAARGEYGVAPRAYVLGVMLSKASHLAITAEPVLRDLQRVTGETVHAGVLDGTDVVSIAHVPADRILAFNFGVGTRIPAYASSLGRVLLAHLPEDSAIEVLQQSDRRARTARTLTSIKDLRAELRHARERGFCTVTDEVEIGVSSVAAPVVGPSGVALAALNVVVPTPQVDGANGYDALAPPVVDAARELSRRLGSSPRSPR